MKKIGILGGMSAASTQIYYKTLCDLTFQRFGDLTSPNLLLRSVNFAPLAALMHAGEWGKIGDLLNREAIALEQAGAESLVLATNTMHKLAEAIMQSVNIPLIHIADVTAEAVIAGACKAPAFIATKFTMEGQFYLDKLIAEGLAPVVPNAAQRERINRIIFEELCRDEVTTESQQDYVEIVNDLKAQGADSVILGCTEVCLLLNQENCGVPVFDTTQIHCEAALKHAL